MQRTVKSTMLTIAKVGRVNGELTATTSEIKVNGVTDEKAAIRKAKKELGEFIVLDSTIVEDLWVLEDETFFKYAHIEAPNEQ
jgi:hypothetical protein